MARRRQQTDAGQGEPNLLKANRSLSRQDRTLLAVSLVLLLLLLLLPLFGRASAAQEQTHDPALTQTRAQGSALSEHPDNLRELDHRGLANWGIEFSGDELPQLSAALDTDIKAEITGRVARVDVRQRFRTIDHDWSEAIYRFPLPAGAAVDSLLVEAGGRIVEGEIQEKRKAKGHYKQARAKGMLERQHPNPFETRLANIEPGEEITVSISFLTRVDYSDSTFSLQLPLTFIPADPLGDHHLRLSIRLHSNMNIASVESRYHDMEMHPTLGGFDLYLADPDTRTERGIELDWKQDICLDGESPANRGANRQPASNWQLGKPGEFLIHVHRLESPARVFPRHPVLCRQPALVLNSLAPDALFSALRGHRPVIQRFEPRLEKSQVFRLVNHLQPTHLITSLVNIADRFRHHVHMSLGVDPPRQGQP